MNLYRLFAMELDRYSHFNNFKLFEKFICNAGEVEISNDAIFAKLKKKRDLPKILEVMKQYEDQKISWLENLPIVFSGLTYS